jgi:hypothetical protein
MLYVYVSMPHQENPVCAEPRKRRAAKSANCKLQGASKTLMLRAEGGRRARHLKRAKCIKDILKGQLVTSRIQKHITRQQFHRLASQRLNNSSTQITDRPIIMIVDHARDITAHATTLNRHNLDMIN